ncbi:hypothetical protein [Pelagibius sp. Alg239-R121]|uniref:hypothetical protein n=1 Tax=Pelagibius sp. Alg239-R121 TaxID=2993448 RepID=UPI0024A6911A|nr:hypothetical protein [Pelagibius sp. Alg239-R121]
MDALKAFADIAPFLSNPLVLVGFVLLLFFGIHRTLIKSGVLRPLSERQGGVVVKLLLKYGFVIALVMILCGFGYAFYTATLDVERSAKVAETVKVLQEAHEREIAEYQRREEAYQRRDEELTKAVTAFAHLAEKPDAPQSVEDAQKELEAGNPEAAEQIFADTLERKAAEGEAANKEAAAAARHLGALATLNDAQKALVAYRRASKLDPEYSSVWISLGDAAVTAGSLAEAERAFRQYLEFQEQDGDEREISVSHNRIGDVQVAQGDLSGALKSYQAGLEIADRLASQDPGNAGWQRDLSVSHERIGDVWIKLGKEQTALVSYSQSYDIAKKLAEKHPEHPEFQSDLTYLNEKLSVYRGVFEK